MAAEGDTFKYSGEVLAEDPAWRVVIAPGPSRQALAWVTAVTVTALAAILATAIPLGVRAVLCLALLCGAFRAARRHALRKGPGAVGRFVVHQSGRIEVEPVSGSPARGRVASGSFVAPWLVVVRWRPEGARWPRTIFLLPDMAGEQEMRRLRVLLRWGDF